MMLPCSFTLDHMHDRSWIVNLWYCDVLRSTQTQPSMWREKAKMSIEEISESVNEQNNKSSSIDSLHRGNYDRSDQSNRSKLWRLDDHCCIDSIYLALYTKLVWFTVYSWYCNTVFHVWMLNSWWWHPRTLQRFEWWICNKLFHHFSLEWLISRKKAALTAIRTLIDSFQLENNLSFFHDLICVRQYNSTKCCVSSMNIDFVQQPNTNEFVTEWKKE